MWWCGSVHASGLCLLLLTLSLEPALGKTTEYHGGGPADEAIWQEPDDIRARNLIDGPGGHDGRPKGPLIFIKEDLDETKPKLWVADATGARWKIKLGSEAQPEVVATRLVWAVGYFADENYYEPFVKVENLPPLYRGRKYQSAGGVLHGARLERIAATDNKLGDWSWFDNPFVGTRELNGLRVMMALIGNWDISSRNNAIGSRQGEPRAYYVSDLGSSFGGSSASAKPSRNNVADYEQSVFIRRSSNSDIDFAVRSCSPAFAVLAAPFYAYCKRLAMVVEDIPRADARWIGSLLGQLSQQQIADAFRAAGYESDEVERYARVVSARISQLEQL